MLVGRITEIDRPHIANSGLLCTDDYNAYSTPETDGSHGTSGASTSGRYPAYHHAFPGAQDSQDAATLSLIAASATNLEASMPPNMEHQQSENIDSPQLPVVHHTNATDSAVTHLENPIQIDSVTTPAMVPCLEPASGPLLNAPSANRGLAGASKHPQGHEKYHGRAQKVRGKFTDSRRQEVQNIRKKGACIRCRMLRKTVCLE